MRTPERGLESALAMSDDGKRGAMKSAYELALERLEAQGIERPRAAALSPAAKDAIAEARRVTEAKLAELEILHRSDVAKLGDPAARDEAEQRYLRERERLIADGEARVERLRADG